MSSVAELQARVTELEKQLREEQEKNKVAGNVVARPKIHQMSSEVVDSNPYRCDFEDHCIRIVFKT